MSLGLYVGIISGNAKGAKTRVWKEERIPGTLP